MQVAILSDIHGNPLALEAVLADLAARGGADLLAIAGDLCLDGPQPREVVERVLALGCPVVQGNTDRDLAATPAPDEGAGALLAWTRAALGEEYLAYLRDLPFAHEIAAPDGSRLLIVHANPRNLDEHLRPYASEPELLSLLGDLAPEITTIAFGHLHIPYTRRVGRFLLADIASVGLPKDGDRRAGYGLLTWTDAGWQVEQRRVEYPVEEVVAQLRAAAPPESAELIKRLLRARYPNMTAARGGRPPRAARQPAAAPDAPPDPPAAASDEPAALSLAPEALPDIVRAEPAPPIAIPPEVSDTTDTAPDDETASTEAVAKPGKRHKGKGHAGKKPVKPPPLLATIGAMTADLPFSALLPALLGERLAVALPLVARVRAGDDPEAVHDLRVALRRLRATLGAAEPYYRTKPYQRQQRRIKALAGALGAVRDNDVLLALLGEYANGSAPDERPGLARLGDALAADREQEHRALLQVLDAWDEQDGSYAADFHAFSAQPRRDRARDWDSVTTVAARALTRDLDQIDRRAGELEAVERDDVEAFHRVRIAAKHVRYTLELFAPVLNDDTPASTEELRRIQDTLGRLHDWDVLRELLLTERVATAEHDIRRLHEAVMAPGSRAARLAAVRELLAAPDAFVATAPGIYGVLAEATDERARLAAEFRARWALLEAGGFRERLRALTTITTSTDEHVAEQ
ncbi:MAG TPA: CHAD domain-containing protein [Thermomicrobiales bacterium]|nr:CHAD domain-containing protein [Thermomicrobiales bacterium]